MSTQKIIIPATTNAATSELTVLVQDGTAMSLISNGYQGSEQSTIQIYDPALEDWFDAIYKGDKFILNVQTNWLDLWQTHIQIRIVKSATVNPVGVTVRYNNANTN